VYDSLGNAHEATLTYIPVATDATAATALTVGAAVTAGVTVSPSANQNDTITITSIGGNQYKITDTLGTSQTVNGASTVTIDNTSITLASGVAGTQTITVTAASNGLPTGVANASGTMESPATCWEVECSFTDGTTFQTITQPGEVDPATGKITAPTLGSGSSGVLGYVYFNQSGQFINSSSIDGSTTGGAYSIGPEAASGNYVHTAGGDPNVLQGDQLNVTLWGQSAGNAAQAPTQAASPGAIGLSYGGDATQGGMASLASDYSATVLSQNGYAAGTLENISIGTDGTITGAFTNGQQKTLAQVAVATFANEDGLIRDGGNQFSQSVNSGLARVGVAGTGSLGSIQSGALEQSNVSLANEFTNLIVAQRAFEANTRGITTADQNLQTIINLRASEN